MAANTPPCTSPKGCLCWSPTSARERASSGPTSIASKPRTESSVTEENLKLPTRAEVTLSRPMATLDQLPPEQRAIVELVVQRGRSYETLAEVLQVPSARERELARKKPLRAVEAEEEKAEPEPERGALSPEAQSALKRRRIVGAVAALAILAAIVIGALAIAGAFSSDKKKSASSASASTAASTTTPSGTSTTPGQPPVQVVGGIALNPIGRTKARGLAYIVQ